MRGPIGILIGVRLPDASTKPKKFPDQSSISGRRHKNRKIPGSDDAARTTKFLDQDPDPRKPPQKPQTFPICLVSVGCLLVATNNEEAPRGGNYALLDENNLFMREKTCAKHMKLNSQKSKEGSLRFARKGALDSEGHSRVGCLESNCQNRVE